MRLVSQSLFHNQQISVQIRTIRIFVVHKIFAMSAPTRWRQPPPAKDCQQPWQGRLSDLNATNLGSRLIQLTKCLEKIA